MKKYLMNIVLVFSFLGLLNAQNESSPKMYVNATLLNLRSEPSLNARIVEQLKIKDVVEFQYKTIYTERINGAEGTWVKIKTDHNEGFVFDCYLDFPIMVYSSVNNIASIDEKYCYSVSDIEKSLSLNRIYNDSYSNIEQFSFPYVVFSSYKPIVKNKSYHQVITNGLVNEGNGLVISNVLDSLNNNFSYSLKLLVSNGFTALYLDKILKLSSKNKERLVSSTQIKLSDTVLSEESIELVWHGDINGDNYPDLILNVTSETLSTQFFVVSSGMGKHVFYSEWDKKKIIFKVCFK